MSDCLGFNVFTVFQSYDDERVLRTYVMYLLLAGQASMSLLSGAVSPKQLRDNLQKVSKPLHSKYYTSTRQPVDALPLNDERQGSP